jgi:hypothetical protein
MEINEKVLELKAEEQTLQQELSDWKSKTPSGNMGKWHRQVKLDSINDRLEAVQKQIHFHDSIYLSNEIYKQWDKI